MKKLLAPLPAAFMALAACGGGGSLGPQPAGPRDAGPTAALRAPSGPSSKIAHVVIIFQENRTTDDLFNGLPGADTVRSGMNSKGQVVALAPISLSAPYDLGHKHSDFKLEYDNGKLDGFDKDSSNCEGATVCIPKDIRAYGYVPRDEVKPYFTMATRYAFGDRMFQTNQGPSFPAHQYIVSGTSTVTNKSPLRAADNPLNPQQGRVGGCDSAPGSLVPLIDPAGKLSANAFPCFNRISLMELAERKSVSWRYYVDNPGPGIWNGPDAILHVRTSREYSSDVVSPSSKVLTDIAGGKLAEVVWVTPSNVASDHARATNGSGPSWVASIVNAIGESPYWSDTAIVVTWDDWGGWYDHVPPPLYNSYELGFRVPLIVISPYAKTRYVSHVQHEFGSILKFTEEVFGLPSLGTTDVRADDLADCFDFSQPPTKFKRIPSKFPPAYFVRQRVSNETPDY
jgi:phospholipase C